MQITRTGIICQDLYDYWIDAQLILGDQQRSLDEEAKTSEANPASSKSDMVQGKDINIDNGSSVYVSAYADEGRSAYATGTVDGSITVNADPGGSPEDQTIIGVEVPATVKQQGNAFAAAIINGTIAVGSENAE